MEIQWEILPLIAGFIFSYLIYNYKKFRMGGVFAIPLMAVYTIKYPLMLLLICGNSIITYFILNFLMEKFVIYGRRLLYISLSIGLILMSVSFVVLHSFTWYSVLLPGLIAYNYHREKYLGVKIGTAVFFNALFYIVCLGVAVISFWFLW